MRSLLVVIILTAFCTAFSSASFGQVAVGISVRIGPPALPVYAQPICPGPGYLWTPGYWAWSDDDGYYWVPGTWVVAPVGMLWTPGWWGWGGGLYIWHPGYWGPHVGFYGGINYGFGYTGVGFYGGEWRGGAFYYNRSVTNVSVTNVTNVYNRTVIVNENHVAFNGPGGVQARETAHEQRYEHERHIPAVAAQTEHQNAASHERQNFARENHGRPVVAATARPADFSRRSVVAARAAGGEYHAPAISPREARVASNAGNRGNSSRPSNEGFRPFNAPSKGGNASANNRGANSNQGFRPFNPPSKGGNANADRGGRSNASSPSGSYNRGNERGNQSSANNSRYNENRPQNQPHETSRPSSNPPRENSRPSEPAGRQGPPPRQEKPRGR
jgi:hypothetical protein